MGRPASVVRVHTLLPPGQWESMDDRQRTAWRNFCNLAELDRRVRADPSILSLPPRRQQGAESQPRS